MSKFQVVQLTQEALKVQCKVDDHEEWGAPFLNLAQYLRKEEIQRVTTFSQRGSIFWALVDKDYDVVAGPTVLYCHCESHRFDCAVRRSSGEIMRGFSHHIGSVFTLPQYRKQGLATLFMTEVARQLEALPDTLASVLYSDIGPTFYDKLGWKVFPSKMAALNVAHPLNVHADTDNCTELLSLTLDESLNKFLEADNARLVEELASDCFQGKSSFVILPTRDSIEWQFCIGVHFAQVRQHKELPSCCGKAVNENAFIIWCHNLKESTLYILRARFPNDGDKSYKLTLLLLNEALKEARRFKLEKVAIWDPPLVLTNAEIRSQFEMQFVEREDSLSSAMIFRLDSSDEGTKVCPYWLANEKYAWV